MHKKRRSECYQHKERLKLNNPKKYSSMDIITYSEKL